MKYQLTFKDKLYLLFHQKYIDRMDYLRPKVEDHIKRFCRKNKKKLPNNFYNFIFYETERILREFDDYLES